MTEQPQERQATGDYEPPAVIRIAPVDELTAGTDTFSPVLDGSNP